jgi:hypothetical protein
LDTALAKLRRTKRPERAELGALLTELKEMPVYIDVEFQLERVVGKYDRWVTATSRAIEVHEASRLTETGGQILPLSEGMLHQLCKSGECARMVVTLE